MHDFIVLYLLNIHLWDKNARGIAQRFPSRCLDAAQLVSLPHMNLHLPGKWHYVMTTALWTQGPSLPSLSAGHRYVLTESDAEHERCV